MADRRYKYQFIITGEETDAVNALKKVDKEAKKVGTTVKKSTSTMDKFRKALAPITSVTIFGYMAARAARMSLAIERAAESVTLLDRRMNYLTGDALALDKIRTAAYEVGVEFSSLGNTVGRFAVATKNAFTVDELLEWNKAIILAGKAVGSSTQESIAGVRQLSQAFSKGKLDGDEFRSVVENLPALATIFRDIAEETGQNIFDMAEQGKIQTELMIEAFNRLKETVKGVGDIVTHTISSEFDRVRSEWAFFVASLSEGDSVFRDLAASTAEFLKQLNDSSTAITNIKLAANAMFKSVEFLLTGGALYLGITATLALLAAMEAKLVALMFSYSALNVSAGTFLALMTGPAGWAVFLAGMVTAVKYADDLTKAFYRLIGVQQLMHDESVDNLIIKLAMVRRQEERLEKQIELETNPARTKALEKNLKYAREQIKVLEKQHEAYIKSFEAQEKIHKGLVDGEDANQQYLDFLSQIGGSGGALEAATGGTKDFRKELEKLFDLDIPKDMDKTVQAIDNFAYAGNTALATTSALSNMMNMFARTAEKSKESTKGLKEEIVKTTEVADPFKTVWDETLRDLDSGFRSMWEGVVDGSLDSLDFIKQAAQKWLAQMLHMFTTQKMVASFGATFAASGAANASGGVSSPGLLSGIGNYGSALGSTLSAGSMALGFGGEQAAMLAAQNSGMGLSGISSTFSALGGSLSTLLPVVGGFLGLASMFGLFDGNSDTSPDLSLATGSSNQDSLVKWMDTNEAGTDTSFTAQSRYGNIDAMTQHGFFGSEGEATDYFEKLTAGLNQLDDAIFYAVDESTNAAIEKVMGRNWAKEVKFEEGGSVTKLFQDRFNRIFDEIGGRMNQVYDAMIDSGTDTEEAVLRVTSVFGALSDYVDTDLTTAFEDFTEQQTIANESLYQSYQRSLGALGDAAIGFEWSADSLEEMSILITNNRQLEIGLLNQIKTLSQEIDSISAGYTEKWTLDTLDPAQTRDYWWKQIRSNFDELQTAVDSGDPTEIFKETQETLGATDKYWGLLSTEEQKELLPGFLTGKAAITGLGKDGLSESEKFIKDMADKITTAVKEGLKDPVQNMSNAADNNVIAADMNLVAAGIPKPVDVTVTLAYEGGEVGY